MRASRTALSLCLVAGCVKGNPEDGEAPEFHGGSIQPPGCTYLVTTGEGAEAPEVAPDEADVDPTPKQVRLGLAGDARTSMVVQWRTTDEKTKASTVRWGKGTALDQTSTGLTFAYLSGFNGNGGEVRMHEAHLCGLEADTQYSYQVGSSVGGVDSFSPTFTFRTAPDVSLDASAEVVIGVVGDSRDGYAVQRDLFTQLAGKTPDLILFTGDAVTLGQIQPEWEEFFDAAEPLIASVPMISAHGNHEVNAINYYAQFAMPGDEEDYGLDYGWMHLTVLNDSPPDIADLTGKMPQFLQSDLTAHDAARWKIVMHHRPAYSSATAHGSDTQLRATLGPIFDQHGVDLVLNGHDHDYERSKPMNNETPVGDPASGTVYVVDGGLGAELYDNATSPFTAISEKTHSALIIRLRRDTMNVEVFRPDGSMVDTFSETKPPPS